MLLCGATAASAVAERPTARQSNQRDQPGRLGAIADAGLPDGLMAGLVVRVSPRWRLHGALGHNTLSAGARAGLRADALTGAFSPFIAAETGAYRAGDSAAWTDGLVARLGRDGAAVDRIAYRFDNLHLGLRVGDRRAMLFLQGGLSRVRAELGVSTTRGDGAIDVKTMGEAAGWLPGGRFGFMAYF